MPVFPNVVLASGDMVAIDGEAVSILQGYPGSTSIQGPVERLGQIEVALSHGLGSLDYDVVSAPANLHTIQPGTPEREIRF